MAYASDLAWKILREHTDFISGYSEVTLLGYCDDYEAGEILSRYLKASEFASGVVLDCASGCCYGSSVLGRSKFVDHVISVDIDRDLLMYGRKVYDADCVCADCTYLPFREGFFDSAVTIETLEHVRDQPLFLKGMRSILKRNGRLILNTPNKLFTSPFLASPINPYHLKEFYLGELDMFLRSCGFKVESVWGQGKFSGLKLIAYFIYSLSKHILHELSVKPIWVDGIYGAIKSKVERYHFLSPKIDSKKVTRSVEPDPKEFPYVEIQASSNFKLYKCFMFYCYKNGHLP